VDITNPTRPTKPPLKQNMNATHSTPPRSPLLHIGSLRRKANGGRHHGPSSIPGSPICGETSGKDQNSTYRTAGLERLARKGRLSMSTIPANTKSDRINPSNPYPACSGRIPPKNYNSVRIPRATATTFATCDANSEDRDEEDWDSVPVTAAHWTKRASASALYFTFTVC